MPLNLFYTMVQKSQKWPKTQIKGGSVQAGTFVHFVITPEDEKRSRTDVS